jgi:chromosome segregation ATPase
VNLDELPQQFDALIEAARAALHVEITNARGIVAAANAETQASKSELADLQGQLKQVQADLKSAHAYLQRGSTLAALDHEIAEQRKRVEAGKLEKAELEKALAALAKQCAEREKAVVALNNEVTQLAAVRTSNEEAMQKMRYQLGIV